MTKETNKQFNEPELCTHPEPFCVVGYPFEGAPSTLGPAERGAYWQGKQFPAFDAAEYEKIGGGPSEIGVWTHEGDALTYVFGYVAEKIGYVPETMRAVTIPVGEFAVFRAPAHQTPQELGDNLRATWRYACETWLPASGYIADTGRMAFEYYLGSSATVYIPVKEK